MLTNRPKTLLCDIDGTIFKHTGDISRQSDVELELLPGIKDKWKEFDFKGYKIILITGRRESERAKTEIQLNNAGIFYDQLIMGIGNGIRVLINDRKPNSEEDTAIAINLERNAGIKDIDI